MDAACSNAYSVYVDGTTHFLGYAPEIYLTFLNFGEDIYVEGGSTLSSAYSASFWRGDDATYTQAYFDATNTLLRYFDRKFDLDPQTNEGFFTCSWFADDADGDGYSLEDGDCNDGAAWISPAAVEIPNNGVDNNCDGTELCFSDLDGDGYRGVTDTNLVVGTVCPNIAPLQDCDDSDPNKNPGIPEVPCNHIDENCDGQDM